MQTHTCYKDYFYSNRRVKQIMSQGRETLRWIKTLNDVIVTWCVCFASSIPPFYTFGSQTAEHIEGITSSVKLIQLNSKGQLNLEPIINTGLLILHAAKTSCW